MTNETGRLRAVTEVEVISVVDNCLESRSEASRQDTQSLDEWTPDPDHARRPRAEHGLSCLVRTYSDSETHTLLFDTAFEPGSVADNASRMCLDLSGAEAIVLSHEHWDHTGGIVPLLRALTAKSLPVVVHPAVFRKRAWRDPDDPDAKIRFPPSNPDRDEITAAGGRIVEAKGSYLLCGDTVLVTGEVPRRTGFEPGMPFEWTRVDGEWHHDPRVIDDRSIVMNVRDRGLVVVSGCAHSGIVNTVRYAVELTGVTKVAAIIGGFHLAGKHFEPHLGQTVTALREFEPDLLVPSHCTGWPGRFALAQAFPSAFVPNSVGNLYRIKSLD
jgi:7,8-dihydropterin-6-yl-methyl-4-(beta-D-ribofuranosyl)aminobenzene 5'-phosphate synthase